MKKKIDLTVMALISILAFCTCAVQEEGGTGTVRKIRTAESVPGTENTGISEDTNNPHGSALVADKTDAQEGQDMPAASGAGVPEGQGASVENGTDNSESQGSSVTGGSVNNLAMLQQDDSIPEAYKEILVIAYEVILRMHEDAPAGSGLVGIGVREACIGRNVEESLAGIGYILYDVDGNGVRELIIADTGDDLWDNRILNMYTIREDEAVMLLDGVMRGRFYILSDGIIYYEGDGGVGHNIFATYRMGADGASLEPIDYYFSDYAEGASYDGGVSWFHNTTGEHDMKISEVMEWENEEIPWKMQEEFVEQVMLLELIPFSVYR